MKKDKEFERITGAGLVNMLDSEKIEAVPLHYCHGKWYGPNRDGGFSSYKDSQAGALLGAYSYHRSEKGDMGNTSADLALLWLMQNRSVNYAGPLAGYPVGVHSIGQQRVLVTEALRLIEPKAGQWITINQLVQTLLEDADHDQVTVFYTWLATSLRHLYERLDAPGDLPFTHCPALGLFGERGSGKSALIEIVLMALFGQRSADPLTFLKEGKFNKDLFPAALLVMDDKGAAANLEERRTRGDAMKALIWTEFQRMEGKGVDALMVSPFWRLIIAGNTEDSSLNICPTLNESLKDKLILLKARRADGLPDGHEEKVIWVKKLRAELPAFANFLLRWRPPRKTPLDPRTGMVNFWHPEIAGALLEKQPECNAIQVIDLLDLAPWEGTATAFFMRIRELDAGGNHLKLFPSIDQCGRMLSELAKALPGRVQKKLRDGVSHYVLTRKD